MTTAVHPDEEVIWAESTTGDSFQCVHVDDWLTARARIVELEAFIAKMRDDMFVSNGWRSAAQQVLERK